MSAQVDNVYKFLARKVAAHFDAARKIDCQQVRALALLAARTLEVVLKHHRPVDEGDLACAGCGLTAYEDMATRHIDECPVLAEIAELHLHLGDGPWGKEGIFP
jgi:hypothetical protein